MIFTREAVPTFEPLQKGGGIGVENTSIELCILLSASRVCGCSFNVQLNVMLLGAEEHCVVEVRTAKGISCAR